MIDRSRFISERNLVLWLDEAELSDGVVVRHDTVLWCEAADREYARYIAKALNQQKQEIFYGSKQSDGES